MNAIYSLFHCLSPLVNYSSFQGNHAFTVEIFMSWQYLTVGLQVGVEVKVEVLGGFGLKRHGVYSLGVDDDKESVGKLDCLAGGVALGLGKIDQAAGFGFGGHCLEGHLSSSVVGREEFLSIRRRTIADSAAMQTTICYRLSAFAH